MKTVRYTFLATARWVTDDIQKELEKQFSAQVEVKRDGGGGVGGSLSVKVDGADDHQKVREYIASHLVFKHHFTLAT